MVKLINGTAPVIVTVDGKAASGKSTTSRLVAAALGFRHLDTGAMYRTAALAVINSGVDPGDEEAVSSLVVGLEIGVEFSPEGTRLFLDGRDVTAEIRSQEVSAMTSRVSTVAAVRAKMVKLQRELAEGGCIVVEGRDIGTIVFPDAEIKLFLTASVGTRARRRYAEVGGNGSGLSLKDIKEEIRERDMRDSSRELSPLVPAEDAVIIDTTDSTVEEQVTEIINIITNRLEMQTVEETASDVRK